MMVRVKIVGIQAIQLFYATRNQVLTISSITRGPMKEQRCPSRQPLQATVKMLADMNMCHSPVSVGDEGACSLPHGFSCAADARHECPKPTKQRPR